MASTQTAAHLDPVTQRNAHDRPLVHLDADALSERVLTAWIHHDNMLEGAPLSPDEIVQALAENDEVVPRYLHPLMNRIRAYRDAIRFVQTRARGGLDAVALDNLRRIHKMLTPAANDRGGQYRRTSPVHRDYFQSICSADKVPYYLRKLMEQVQAEAAVAHDPIAFAAEFHHQYMHAYPFRRNPGTTARLFTNLLLMAMGQAPAIIPAQARQEYYKALNHPEPERLTRIYRGAVRGFLMEAGRARRSRHQAGVS
jgi:Fic family protein